METKGMEEVASPADGLTGRQLATVALEEQPFESPVDVVIDLSELDRRIPGAKVRPPPA
jgi:hypothetical protein